MTGNPAPANAPANPIEAWIRNKIKETGADSADARAKIYLECSGIIDLKLKSIPSVEEYMKHKAAYDEKLNRVKNQIEGENKTLFDRTVEFGKRHMPFAAAVAAAINLIADWAKPIAEFTGLLAVGSLTGLAGAWVIGRLAKKQGPRNACASAVFLFGAVSVVSIGVLGVRNFIPGAQATGVVAQIIPGMEVLQQQVFGLSEQLAGISQQSGRTADAAEQISETAWYSADPNQLWRRALASGNLAHLKRLKVTGYVPDQLEVSMIASEPLREGLRKAETIRTLSLWQPQFDRFFCNTNESYPYLKDAIENIGVNGVIALCKDIKGIVENHISELELQWKPVCMSERARNDMTSCRIDEIKNTKIRDMNAERYMGLIAPFNRQANALLYAREVLN